MASVAVVRLLAVRFLVLDSLSLVCEYQLAIVVVTM